MEVKTSPRKGAAAAAAATGVGSAAAVGVSADQTDGVRAGGGGGGDRVKPASGGGGGVAVRMRLGASAEKELRRWLLRWAEGGSSRRLREVKGGRGEGGGRVCWDCSWPGFSHFLTCGHRI